MHNCTGTHIIIYIFKINRDNLASGALMSLQKTTAVQFLDTRILASVHPHSHSHFLFHHMHKARLEKQLKTRKLFWNASDQEKNAGGFSL